MTVVSKYLDEAIVRYEKLGFSKLALSKGIVSIAVGAYVAHISYPYLTKLIKAANLAPVLSETANTSDDDTSDFDSDSESDDYESAIETNNISCNGNIEHKGNHESNRKSIKTFTKFLHFKILANDVTEVDLEENVPSSSFH